MWPFGKSKERVVPEVVFGGVVAKYDKALKSWGFWIRGYSYDVAGEEFDVAVIEAVKRIPDELEALSEEIRGEIKKHLEGWCDYNGEEKIIGVDVTELLDKGRYDVCYGGSDMWGDLIVDVVIEKGKIVDSYAGD